MNNFNPSQIPLNKKTLLAAFLLIVIPLLFFVLSYSTRTRRPNVDSPTPTSSVVISPAFGTNPEKIISPLQRSHPGESVSVPALENQPGYIGKQDSGNGRVTLSFSSPLTVRPNEVTVSQGVAVFERMITPEDTKELGYAKVSDYLKKYGEPERTIQGSKFYDFMAFTYIYAQKGFAFIGNPHTDEIFEFHVFVPTSVNDYLSNFGDDVDLEGGHEDELP